MQKLKQIIPKEKPIQSAKYINKNNFQPDLRLGKRRIHEILDSQADNRKKNYQVTDTEAETSGPGRMEERLEFTRLELR